MKHQAPRGTRDLLPGEIERWQWAEATRARRARALRLSRDPHADVRGLRAVRAHLGRVERRGPEGDVPLQGLRAIATSRCVPRARPACAAPTSSTALARPGRASTGCGTWGRCSATAARRRGATASSGRSAPRSSARRRRGADVEMIALFVDLFEAWGFRELDGRAQQRRHARDAARVRRAAARVARAGARAAERRLAGAARDAIRCACSTARIPTTSTLLRGGEDGRAAIAADAAHARRRSTPRAARTSTRCVAGLDAIGIAHEIDHGLVRGLDYYTRTAFEVHDRSLGAQSALGGGGRYDGLIEELGGPATPGVGFSIGLDRALLAIEERGGAGGRGHAGRRIVAAMDGTRAAARALIRELRRGVRGGRTISRRAASARR